MVKRLAQRFRPARVPRGYVVTAAVSLLLGAAALLSPWDANIRALSFDCLAGIAPPMRPNEVVVLYIDEASRARLQQTPDDRWDRRIHTQIVQELHRRGAALIAFDVLFDDPSTNVAVDEALGTAMREHGKVLLAASEEHIAAHGATISRLLVPADSLETNAAIGVIELPRDRDGVVRRHLRTTRAPIFAEEALKLFAGRKPKPADRWIRFYGGPGSLLHASYHQALEARGLHEDFFRGKAVFIGMAPIITYQGRKGDDLYKTAFTRWTGREAAGVEMQATIFANLLHHHSLSRTPRSAEIAIVILSGLLAGAAALRPKRALAGMGLVILFNVALAGVLFLSWNVWYPWLIPLLAQLPAALFIGSAFQAARVREDKARLEERIAHEISAGTPKPFFSEAPARARPLLGAPSIPDHELIRCIGRGAYGEVWLARSVIGTFHAVKIVYRRRFSSAEPYEREFHGMQKFTPISRSHPGLIHVLHVGRDEKQDCFFYIMELSDDELRGQSIDPETYTSRSLAGDLQRRGRFDAAETVELGLALSATLEFLHGLKLIHRDIKPANILFVNGLAKIADVGLVTNLSDDRQRVSYGGTEGYIAPEGPGTAAADVYSLGKVLYEASMGLDRSRFPELPNSINERSDSELLLRLNEVLIKACEPDPRARYCSAAELHSALLQTQQEATRCTTRT